MFEIEKNVEVPTSASMYPFGQMEIGDSFFVPEAKHGGCAAAAYKFARENGVKFSFRKVEGGRRIWRVK